MTHTQYIYYTVSQKYVTTLSLYNFDKHEPILIIFGTTVTEKVGNQKDNLFFHLA